jgi:hypothetical protein
VDTTNGAGSTKFYEDLQLVPSRALDSQQFWFYADKETTLESLFNSPLIPYLKRDYYLLFDNYN